MNKCFCEELANDDRAEDQNIMIDWSYTLSIKCLQPHEDTNKFEENRLELEAWFHTSQMVMDDLKLMGTDGSKDSDEKGMLVFQAIKEALEEQ